MKLYEYLGSRKPIITSAGTLAGNFVAENEIGWSLPYNENGLNALFNKLIESPELLTKVQQKINTVTLEHTWQARAKQLIKDLT